MACQAKGREVRIIHYHVGQYRLVLVVVQPWDMVDNSINPWERMSGRFSPYLTVRVG